MRDGYTPDKVYHLSGNCAESQSARAMTSTQSRALILHSGGLDSSVCLLQALELGRTVTSLGIDYGQRHRIELEYAASQCKKLGVERKVIRVSKLAATTALI